MRMCGSDILHAIAPMQLDSMEVLKLLPSLVGGGLAGSILTHYVTTRRQRLDIAMKVMDGLFQHYNELGGAKFALTSESTLTVEQLNQVRRVGDWLEFCALLYFRGSVDKDLMKKFGVPDEMRAFYDLAKTHGQFQDAVRLWKNLHNISIEER